jgi:hypothetical protein
MFFRKKVNKSGVVSIQVIDKSNGKYKVHKTIGSSSESIEIDKLVEQAKSYIKSFGGQTSIDFILVVLMMVSGGFYHYLNQIMSILQ